jgi:phosphopantothenoylcysteine decarboxylase/phosphopantothenate--cysteine ligase
MLAAVLLHGRGADALVMAAAVADFRAAAVAEHKIKKKDDSDGLTLELVRNPDILAEVARTKEANPADAPRVVVGFAAESQNLLDNAEKKLTRKRLDMIVANDILASDAGFSVETNRVTLVWRDGRREALPVMSKAQVAEAILARVADLLG